MERERNAQEETVICAVCRAEFCEAGWSSPAEPCECGKCWSFTRETTEDEAHEQAALRAVWLANGGDWPSPVEDDPEQSS